MFDSSDIDEDIDAYLREWSHWIQEREQWVGDIEVWEKHLRQLMLLIHELDNALPYEHQRLSAHLDAVHEHLATLEEHGKVRYAHARVHDAISSYATSTTKPWNGWTPC